MSAYAVLLSRPLLAGCAALADLPQEQRECFCCAPRAI